MLIMKRGKREKTEGIKIPKPEKYLNVQREGKSQVLGNTES